MAETPWYEKLSYETIEEPQRRQPRNPAALPAPRTKPQRLARDREMMQLRRQGWGIIELGERYGISFQRVWQILVRNGVG